MYFSGSVLAAFTNRLPDVVKNVGEAVVIHFSTDHTAPHFLRVFPNGTKVILVSTGRVSDSYDRSRFNVTSVPRGQGGYNVTVTISEVRPEDAGTYLASADNYREKSEKNYMEFIVVCMSSIFCTA